MRKVLYNNIVYFYLTIYISIHSKILKYKFYFNEMRKLFALPLYVYDWEFQCWCNIFHYIQSCLVRCFWLLHFKILSIQFNYFKRLWNFTFLSERNLNLIFIQRQTKKIQQNQCIMHVLIRKNNRLFRQLLD